MGNYKALLLDADDTLLDFRENERESVRKVFVQMGFHVDDMVLRRYSEINKALWLSHERGEISKQMIWDQRFAKLFEELHLPGDGEKAEKFYRAALGEGAQTIPGAVELCRTLCQNYALYIVTNGTAETQYSRIHKAGLDLWVRDIFISEKLGAPKPAASFFDAVFKRIPFSRNECLIVGDSLTSDIQGGLNAGVDTCWYNPNRLKPPSNIRPTYEIQYLNQLYDLLK